MWIESDWQERVIRVRHWLAVAIAIALMLMQPASGADDENACVLSEKEWQFAEYLERHPEQGREVLVCDSRLQAFASARARDMAERGYFGHVTPDRKGPNALLRKSGYEIPKYYVDGIANSIESILGGVGDPAKAWRLLLESSVHRKHLLGLDEMYAAQTHYGIAHHYRPDSAYAHYWVIVIVKPGTAERPMTCTPAPPVCIVH